MLGISGMARNVRFINREVEELEAPQMDVQMGCTWFDYRRTERRYYLGRVCSMGMGDALLGGSILM